MAPPLPGTRSPNFIHGNPTVQGDVVVRAFVAGDGVLFRITDTATGSWGFYNDSTNSVATVRFVLGMESRVQPIGGVVIHRDEESLMYYGTITIYPLYSEPAFRGYVDSYKLTYGCADINVVMNAFAQLESNIGSKRRSLESFSSPLKRRSFSSIGGFPNMYASVRSITLPSLTSPRLAYQQQQQRDIMMAQRVQSSTDSFGSPYSRGRLISMDSLGSLARKRGSSSNNSANPTNHHTAATRLKPIPPPRPIKVGSFVAPRNDAQPSRHSLDSSTLPVMMGQKACYAEYEGAASPVRACIKAIPSDDAISSQSSRKRVTF